jgi:hypothetical protein
MSRRTRLARVLVIVVVAFGAWWLMSAAVVAISGLHAVNGYWLGPEATCTSATEPDCDAAIQTATTALEARRPGAEVVRAAIASPSCSQAMLVICMTAGGVWNVFVVFDLGDGSREVIGVACPGIRPPGSAPSCRPADLSALEPKGP